MINGATFINSIIWIGPQYMISILAYFDHNFVMNVNDGNLPGVCSVMSIFVI